MAVRDKYAVASQQRSVLLGKRLHAQPPLQIKPSEYLKGKGYEGDGLYTTEALPRGYVVAEYRGVRLTVAAALRKKRSRSYMFDVMDKTGKKVAFVIDAAVRAKSSVARYVNAADYDDDQNVQYKQVGLRIYIVTKKRVQAGAELLGWYGKSTAEVIRQT